MVEAVSGRVDRAEMCPILAHFSKKPSCSLSLRQEPFFRLLLGVKTKYLTVTLRSFHCHPISQLRKRKPRGGKPLPQSSHLDGQS